MLDNYFGNINLSEFEFQHMPFSPQLHLETPQACCKWCDLYKSSNCCDLHDPSYTLGMFDAEVEPSSTKWNPQQLGPRTKFEKDETRSTALDEALCEWRKEEFSHSYPDCQHDMWVGDWLILPDNIINNIIYLAHLNKLTSESNFCASRCSNCQSSGHNGMFLLLLLHSINKF